MDPLARLQAAVEGRYEVKGLVGEGGMALVYEAQDLKHSRPVAIKVLRPEVSAAMGRERFLREIDVAAQLNHPNILSLHDSGESEGLLYFVMPFVEGSSLRERLEKEGPLPVDEAIRITREVGEGLSFAHDKGLVHRDVKPENILFRAGHPVLCDFGIAQATTDLENRLTRTGVSVGTVTYMSPEQLGSGEEVDGRTDLYALGCILFEMLTGNPPFSAPSTQASLAKKLVGENPTLEAARPDLPPTLQEVLDQALATTPGDRFHDTRAFTGALESAVTTARVEADARARLRRKRVDAALKGAGVTALALGAWWLSTVVGGPEMARIAVLPLEDRGRDPSQEYYVQGMHEDLVRELSKAGISVINPRSVVRYAGLTMGIGEIASELHVDGIVEGYVVLGEGDIVLELDLSDGETEDLLWSESFRSSPGQIKSLYRNVTLAIANEIGLELGEEEMARLSPVQEVDPQVYDWLLQARFHWQKLTAEGIDRAEEYYRLATVRDSTSAEAWFGLGQVWFMRVQQGLVSRATADSLGGPHLERARRLDPTLSQFLSQAALEMAWGQWDWEGAVEAMQSALASDPTDSVLRSYYAHLLFYLHRNEEALSQAMEAVSQDPFNTLVQGLYAMDLNYLHRYEEAEAVLNRTLERDPEAPILLSTLRTTYHLLGKQEEALQMWRASYGSQGDEEALAALERGYQEGGYSEALRSVADLFIERSRTRYVTPWQIATLLLRGGYPEPSLGYLEEAFQVRDQNMPYISVDPIFDPLRDEPRFQALMDGLGLPR